MSLRFALPTAPLITASTPRECGSHSILRHCEFLALDKNVAIHYLIQIPLTHWITTQPSAVRDDGKEGSYLFWRAHTGSVIKKPSHNEGLAKVTL